MRSKIVGLVAGLAVASIAVADISVEVKSTALILKPGETAAGVGKQILPGALVQLVWRADNALYQQSREIDLSLKDAGDVILFTMNAAANGKFNAAGARTFNTADLLGAGADINSGYFFARIFETTGVAGDFVLEMGLQGPTLKMYDLTAPATLYKDDFNDATIGAFKAIDAQNITVIPEPATIGLMGAAGIGLYLARRKARR